MAPPLSPPPAAADRAASLRAALPVIFSILA